MGRHSPLFVRTSQEWRFGGNQKENNGSQQSKETHQTTAHHHHVRGYPHNHSPNAKVSRGYHRQDDSDAVWMALAASDGDVDVTRWVMDCGGGDGVAEYELWTEDEIAADEFDEQASTVNIEYSPMSTGSQNSEHSIFNVSDLVLGPSNT